MPELPEVETTRRAIEPVLIGNTFTNIDVLRPNMTLFDPSFGDRLRGKAVQSVVRKGKYLILQLNDPHVLILHLKMSGRLGLRKPDDEPLRYERIRFHMSNGQLLIFNDPRTLGRAYLVQASQLDAHTPLKTLGPDALTVNQETFAKRLRKRRGILKAVLLNQSFVAGIGNIYADEACFLAGIDPNRLTESLSDTEIERLHTAVIDTLEKGIRNMGTSFSDFADLFGKPGKNQHSLQVYGRAGKACFTCGTTLQRSVVGQRGTVWCTSCQK
jgi:formamidopyrimidine-DNA glycosylase